MKPFWITFGQAHAHPFGGYGRTLDRNTVIEIDAENKVEAVRRAYKLFGYQFANIYDKKPNMDYYPGGILKIHGGE